MNLRLDVIARRRRALFCTAFCVLAALACSFSVQAQSNGGFSGGVTPARFELTGAAGDVIRQSLKIFNLGDRPQTFRLRTVDWNYSNAGEIAYFDELKTGSCRPWVRLEAHEVQVVPDPQHPRHFRFETHIPDSAPKAECRFAIMIESLGDPFSTEFNGGAISMPVTGRIAVIVYIGIGGVQADLRMEAITMHSVGERDLPVVTVRNVGDAHGRLDGDLTLKDAHGQRYSLSVATSPVLPGQTRTLKLTPGDYQGRLAEPVTIKGKIYAEQHTYAIDSVLKK